MKILQFKCRRENNVYGVSSKFQFFLVYNGVPKKLGFSIELDLNFFKVLVAWMIPGITKLVFSYFSLSVVCFKLINVYTRVDLTPIESQNKN